jgi:hypothetical protein
MSSSFRVLRVAVSAAFILTADSSAYAGNCETKLAAAYKCSARFEDESPAEYCLTTELDDPTDSIFVLVEENTYSYGCTCETNGNRPNLEFGDSSRDFFCGSYGHTFLVGRVAGNRITGQGYNQPVLRRSVFTCQAVEACP